MKKKLAIFLSMILALGFVLAACGGNDKDSKGNKNEGGKEAAKDKQVLNFNIRTEPPSLHPGKASDNISAAVLYQTFEGLMRLDQKTEKPEPAMAKSYDLSDDKKTYTFHLRDGIKWSNGDPVTAEDFETAWKWVLNPDTAKADYAYQLYPIKGAQAAKEGKGSLDDVGVKAKDDKTLVVELENPTPYFLDLTAFYTYMPVNHKVADKEGKWSENLTDKYVTNGPFLMEKWSHKSKIVLKKNPEYWDAKTVKLETINLSMVDNENTELQMFQNGELDWAGKPLSQLPLSAIDTLKNDPQYQSIPFTGIYYYVFNVKEKPMNNVNIRKALALSIDRKTLVDNVTKGGQLPAKALVPSTIWEENKEGYFKDNDVAEAKKYLKKGLDELGLKELPTIKIKFNTSENHSAIAQAVQDMWKKNLGVNVELGNEEWNVYLDTLRESDFQIGRMGWVADFNDAINFLEIYEHVGGNNYTNWHNDEYSNLLDKARKEADQTKRNDELRKAEKIFMDEMPVAPIYFDSNPFVKKDYVKNIELRTLSNLQFKWAYIAEH